MGAFDDQIAVMGDWMSPSPSPRSFFSSMICDVVAAQPITNSDTEIRDGAPFRGPEENVASLSVGGEEANKSDGVGEPRLGSRRGLMERIAARAGFNAPRLNTESIRTADLSMKQEVQSPYLTIPPGLSPTTLLESPVFLTNSMFLPSPTTGQFQFAQSGNDQGSALMMDDADKGKENNFEDINASAFTFKPASESASFPHFNAANKSFPSDGAVSNGQPKNNDALFHQANFTKIQTENDGGSNNLLPQQTYNSSGVAEHSPPFDEQNQDGDPNNGGGVSEDGYNWKKYGQKHVKGSEFPRSYFRCTHQNCPVKKKVERSQEGHITEIIYKGAHNHPIPLPNRRSNLGSSNALGDMQIDSDQQPGNGGGGDLSWSVMQKGNVVAGHDSKPENLGDQNGAQYESMDVVDGSSPFTNDDEAGDDRANTHDSPSLGYDGEGGDELESKRRRIEAYAPEISGGATRAMREPRVVVQTTSEVDILDDGYRWRKYGQKVVKGNPNPRSYYKCTSAGCNVRKHVERACNDLKSVITTYEGKHNHDVPAARNSGQMNSGGSHSNNALTNTRNPTALSNNIHRPDQPRNRAWFERPPPLTSSFGHLGPPQMGRGRTFGFGSSQMHGLAAGMGLGGGWGPNHNNQGTTTTTTNLPVHPYLGNQMMLPIGELKMEPVTDTGFSSSAYHQLMSRMPLGP